MDFNGDGFDDMIAGVFDGTPYISYGGKAGFQKPEMMNDSAGRRIILGFYYDYEKKNYDRADRSPPGAKNAEDHMVSSVAFDWDNDGDFDLLLGGKEGRLYLQKNEGSREKAQFTGQNVPIQAGGVTLDMGKYKSPRVVDLDKDGLLDLVCLGLSEPVWYRNTGTLGAPSFAAKEPLLGAVKKKGYGDVVDMDGDGLLDVIIVSEESWGKAEYLYFKQRK